MRICRFTIVVAVGFLSAFAFPGQLDPDLAKLRDLGALPWKDDARAYEKVVTESEGSSGSLNLLRRLHAEAKLSFEKRPVDALLAFRWATFLYAQADKETVPKIDVEVTQLRGALMRIPFVSNYPNARVRFLIETGYFSTPVLIPWGDRLLQRNPNDYRVLYAQALNLGGAANLTEVKRGLTLAERYKKLRGNHPSGHIAVASAHYRVWQRTKSKDEASQAVMEYKLYLSAGKPSPEVTARVNRLIKKLNSK